MIISDVHHSGKILATTLLLKDNLYEFAARGFRDFATQFSTLAKSGSFNHDSLLVVEIKLTLESNRIWISIPALLLYNQVIIVKLFKSLNLSFLVINMIIKPIL